MLVLNTRDRCNSAIRGFESHSSRKGSEGWQSGQLHLIANEESGDQLDRGFESHSFRRTHWKRGRVRLIAPSWNGGRPRGLGGSNPSASARNLTYGEMPEPG